MKHLKKTLPKDHTWQDYLEGKLHNFVNIVKGSKEVALREPSSFLKKVADEGESINYDMGDRG